MIIACLSAIGLRLSIPSRIPGRQVTQNPYEFTIFQFLLGFQRQLRDSAMAAVTQYFQFLLGFQEAGGEAGAREVSATYLSIPSRIPESILT